MKKAWDTFRFVIGAFMAVAMCVLVLMASIGMIYMIVTGIWQAVTSFITTAVETGFIWFLLVIVVVVFAVYCLSYFLERVGGTGETQEKQP